MAKSEVVGAEVVGATVGAVVGDQVSPGLVGVRVVGDTVGAEVVGADVVGVGVVGAAVGAVHRPSCRTKERRHSLHPKRPSQSTDSDSARSPMFPFRLDDPNNLPDVLHALPLSICNEDPAGQKEVEEPLSPTHSVDWSNLDRPEPAEVRSCREAIENQEEELCEQYFRERDNGSSEYAQEEISNNSTEPKRDARVWPGVDSAEEQQEEASGHLESGPSMADVYEMFCAHNSLSDCSSEVTPGTTLSHTPRSQATHPCNLLHAIS
eukprot:714056-Prorocentrum_minimum.AAC.4